MKKAGIFLCCSLSLLLCLSGSAFAEQFLKIGTGSAGGFWIPMGATWSTLISEQIPNLKAASTPGSSTGNLLAIQRDKMDIGYGKGFNLAEAYEGSGPFDGNRFPEVRGIASTYMEPLQIIFPKSLNLKTLQDLKGKSVSPGQKSYASEILLRYILDEIGMTYDDFKGVSYLTFSDAAMSMKDRNIDVVVIQTSCPSGSVLDVDVQMPVALLGVPEDILQILENKRGGLMSYTLPGSCYSGMEGRDVVTIASPSVIFTSSKLDEETVYKVTKLMWDNAEKFQALSPVIAQEFVLQNAVLGMPAPLHKGAYKFYKEKGLAIPPRAMPVD